MPFSPFIFCRRCARAFCQWVLLPVAVLAVVGAATLTLLCEFKSDVIASAVEQRLRVATKLPWRVRGPVRPVFSPSPGIAVGNVRVLAASLEQESEGKERGALFSIKTLRLHLRPLELLRGRLRFRLVVLDTPEIILSCDSQGCPLWLPPEEAEAAPPPATDGQNGSRRFIASVAGILRSDYMKTLPELRLSNGTLRKYGPDGKLELAFTGLRARVHPKNTARPLSLAALFSLPPADLEVSFALDLGPGQGETLLQGDLTGRVGMTPPPHKRTVHGDFSSSLIWKDNGKTLLLPDLRLDAEGDAITADLTVDTLQHTSAGKVRIERLSLPRWFLFGRVLPPGLQQALHSLTGGFDFKGSLHGVGAYNLQGVAGDLGVTGYVGTPDFSKPVVEVFLNVGTANLDMIFPFLSPPGTIFPDPEPPEFDFPPLAPYPEETPAPPAVAKNGASANGAGSPKLSVAGGGGAASGKPRTAAGGITLAGDKSPAAENGAVAVGGKSPASAPADEGINVGYDVRIKVARPIVHQVAGGAAEVLVFPHKNATRVAFSGGNLLKGAASGYIDIFDDVVKMHYAADKMHLDLLPENQGSYVRIGGVATGTGDIDIKVGADSSWADIWKFDVNAEVSGCTLTGGNDGKDWRLYAEKARVSGSSDIFTVVSKGVHIAGLWDLSVQGVNTSWNPRGKDAISGKFRGALIWPPVKDGPPAMRNGKPVRQRKGLRELSGKLDAAGSLIIPLASKRVPIKGKLSTGVDWQVYENTVTFDQVMLDGLGSYMAGRVAVNAQGPKVTVVAPVNFKIAPRTLLKEWNLLPGPGLIVPELLTGEAKVAADRDSLSFDALKLQLDGASVTGAITGYFTSDGLKALSGAPSTAAGESVNHWVFGLQAERLDADKYLPPAEAPPPAKKNAPKPPPPPPPSTKKWDLSFFDGFSADVDVFVRNAKVRNLHPQNTRIVGTLRRGRFSVRGGTADLYGGDSTIIAQGTLVPGVSLVSLQRGLFELKGVDLGRALFDRNKSTSYGGKMDFNMDVKGNLTCDADLPAALSGNWHLKISDGIYPAFVGEASGLRNTFDSAFASGVMENGVLRWDNFTLHGLMVDMRGGGWIDLVKKVMDFTISVTLAKVPAVPVRFSGPFDAPVMNVRGAHMVLDTAQNAGSTVFGLFTGVLELPVRALRGVGSLIAPEKKAAPRPVGTSTQKDPEQ